MSDFDNRPRNRLKPKHENAFRFSTCHSSDTTDACHSLAAQRTDRKHRQGRSSRTARDDSSQSSVPFLARWMRGAWRYSPPVRALSCSRSSRRLILPDEVLGKAVTKSIRRGYLYGAIECFTWSWICLASASL